MKNGLKLAAGVGATLLAALPAWAQDAAGNVAEAAPAAAAAFTPTAEMVNKGDVAWMLVASAFVLMMSVPALALFYGGLVRTKNMLSVLMQVLTIVCVAALVWFSWGYSMAFTNGGDLNKYVGGFSKMFLAGVDPTTAAVAGVIVGAPTALAFNAAQGGARVASTATTAGLGNPVLSLIEDVLSFFTVILAFVAPILIPVLLIVLAVLVFRLARRLRRWRDARTPIAG